MKKLLESVDFYFYQGQSINHFILYSLFLITFQVGRSRNVHDILDEVALHSDSECEELSDGDEDDGWPSSSDEETGDGNGDGNDDAGNDWEEIYDGWSSSDDEPLSTYAAQKKPTAKKKKDVEVYDFEARREFVPPADTDFVPVVMTPEPDSSRTPYQYFKLFVTDTMLEGIADETNKYAMQKNGQDLQTNMKEIECFLGIYFEMGLVKMPSISSYWEAELRYEPIAEQMSRNRFAKLCILLHFIDNTDVTDEEKEDRIWKLRPWLNSLRDQFLTVSSSDEHQSIDEVMVAFKGRSILKQYMTKKPKKWGFKLWARCSSAGFCHDFDVYQGKGTGIDDELAPNCGLGGSVVLQLCDSLPRGHQYKVFGDNYFTNFVMADLIVKRNIGQYLGTIQANRVHKAPLKSEKDLEKLGRGSHDTVYEKNRNLVLVRWYDNKCVTLLSTFVGTEPSDEVKRYDKSKKEHVKIARPAAVKVYNKHMGGVDLLDMMSSLYKRLVKSRRWYMYVFYHTLTMAMVNAWFLYKRDCVVDQVKNPLPLRKFQAMAATAMMKSGKASKGRPTAAMMMSPPVKKRKVSVAPVPDIRYDKVDHWPLIKPTRNRCRLCKDGRTDMQCSKCKVFLCLVKGRNCFTTYHQK